jgi:hypothetical protein
MHRRAIALGHQSPGAPLAAAVPSFLLPALARRCDISAVNDLNHYDGRGARAVASLRGLKVAA